jgi:hypothetical protein
MRSRVTVASYTNVPQASTQRRTAYMLCGGFEAGKYESSLLNVPKPT